MKLFERLKACKPDRKHYRIKPAIKFHIDTRNYWCAFIPTIQWCPWIFRFPNCYGVIDIWWLNFHIAIGKWEKLSCYYCKQKDDCIKSGRLEWYNDDVFERGEKCSDYKSK